MRSSTKFAVRSASVAALLALTLVVPAPARAGSDCVTPSGMLASSPLPLDGSMRSFTGNVSPFGQISGILQLQIDYSTMPPTFTGQFTFAARGGTVYGTIQGFFTSGNTYVETLTITGGTGRYKKTSGYATVAGMFDFTTGAGMDKITGGQICLSGDDEDD